MAPTMLEELCKRIQHCCATLRRSRNERNVGSCWLKSLTGFKLCATTCNRVCKRTQHVTSNNVASVCTQPFSLLCFSLRRLQRNGKPLLQKISPAITIRCQATYNQSALSNHALLITKSALVIKKKCLLSQPINIQ